MPSRLIDARPLAGQALLEVAITIGVAALIISALAITTFVGLKNSQFSQNQVQATKYAQEGLEKVRTAKNRDYTICTDPSMCVLWSNSWSVIYDGSDIYTFQTNTSQCSADPAMAAKIAYCLVKSPAAETIPNSFFKREMYIKNESATQKRIIARVTWTDASGSHKSELETVLAQY